MELQTDVNAAPVHGIVSTPAVPMKPYYEDERCTIYNADCRLVLPWIHSGQFVTDPPYGIDLQPQRGKTKAIAGDRRRDAKALMWFVTQEAFRIMPDDSASFFFAGWSEAWLQDVLREWFSIKACIVWRKNMFGIGYHTRPQHEFCFLVHKGEPKPPLKAESDVWDVAKVQDPQHSCEKPVELLRKVIGYYPTTETVIDPFMGSGTTLLAAKLEGRKAIGMEVEEEYCEMAAKRLSQGVLF